ncbi:MAG: ORF6N domain-containing protein [Paludibacteraceae bacterium]|nr:ORF6N domain-containing protein [Paludibacteraceae bacterium]
MNKSIIKTTVQGAVKPQVYNVRGKRVVLDRELAAALGVETRVINQKVKRNINLFSEDSMFQLTFEECAELEFSSSKSQNLGLTSQIVISNSTGKGGSRHLPMVYTKDGISVLEKLLKRDIPIEFEDEVIEAEVLSESWNEGTVVLYQPNEDIKIIVRVENETVWLTQEQMALLFGTTTQNITIHIGNIFEEKEVEERATCKDFLQVQIEGGREVRRTVKLYNLDIIISVGYRVKSLQGTLFRQWALKVLKGVLLHKHYYDSRIDKIEQTISDNTNRIKSLEQKYALIVDTKLPPIEMVFYEGENFKAYDFLCTLIESANNRIVLIDNYIDRKVLLMLNKRAKGVSATIFTNHKNLSDPQLQLDLIEANKKREAPLIQMLEIKHDHDRFLIIDNTSYLLGPSIKDAGVNRCAVVKMHTSPDKILKDLAVAKAK